VSNTNQDQSIALAQADQAARQDFEQQSIDSPVAPCPARQDEIYLLPTRYALAEEAAVDACIQPGIKTDSHPIALRRLRAGYLYLWHADGPLRRFGIASNGMLVEQGLADDEEELTDGTQAGFALNKHHPAWLMYTEIPLPSKDYEALSGSESMRNERMRLIPMQQIATTLEGQHCPALDKAEGVLAELMPEVRDKALAHDYHQNGAQYRKDADALGQRLRTNAQPEDINAYVHVMTWQDKMSKAANRHPDTGKYPPGYWSSVKWDVSATDSWLTKAKTQAGALHCVFAAVDDVLGMLRDLNEDQLAVSKVKYEWDEVGAHKGLIAGFINSLINEDGAELSSIINYRYRDHDIKLTPGQGEQLLQAQRELRPLINEETHINQEVRPKQGHPIADARLARVHAQQQVILQPIRSFIPAELHGHVQGVVLNYRAAKARNATDSRMGAQVVERVRLDAMNQWIETVAEPHWEWVASRREVLLHDTKTLLARHHEATWFVDYDKAAHCTWLSKVALSTLSELCTVGAGVQIATDLLRAPDPSRPLSFLPSGFTPNLTFWVEAANGLANADRALSADNTKLAGEILEQLASTEKLAWLKALGGPDGADWGNAVSRLSAAFVELEAEHIKGLATAPTSIQQFPKSLLSMMLVLKASAQMTVETGKSGFRFSGSLGTVVWDWGRDASQRIRSGLAPLTHQAESLKAYGGVVSLVALLVNGINLASLRERDAHREHDAIRRAEHFSATLTTAAALSAVIQNAALARNAIEVYRHGIRIPLITLLGFVTGAFAAFAGFADLRKLALEQQKHDRYWSKDEWGRLTRGLAQTGLAGAYAGLGGYTTAMVLLNRWTAEKATDVFKGVGARLGWAVLIVEVLYFAWRSYTRVSDIQDFLQSSCWGTQRRWGDSKSAQENEFQALIDMMFKPKLDVATGVSIQQMKLFGVVPVPATDLYWVTKGLELILPGADPDTARVGIKIIIVQSKKAVSDITQEWLDSMQSEWLPIQEGMGLRLKGPVRHIRRNQHVEVQVRYHSPIAMLTGTLDEAQPIIGGERGMRYIVYDGEITEHRSDDVALPSDEQPMRIVLSQNALQPRSST
tara:strand:+ start:1527 stop:4790 length:3264 start_codon:yes stop_codon:yes gene_type:complete